MSKLPTLVIVSGRPGAGKSTLARKLARSIRCPLIARDDIKEGIVNTLGDRGEPNKEITWTTYSTFFDSIELMLKNKVTVIAEAAFKTFRWEEKLKPLEALADIRIIRCHIETDLANQRVQDRRKADKDWDKFHNSPPVQPATMAPSDYDPETLGYKNLTVDTSSDYDPSFKRIVEFIRA